MTMRHAAARARSTRRPRRAARVLRSAARRGSRRCPAPIRVSLDDERAAVRRRAPRRRDRRTAGAQAGEAGAARSAFVTISPRFFDTVGVQLRRGRGFTRQRRRARRRDRDRQRALRRAVLHRRGSDRPPDPLHRRNAAARTTAAPPAVWRTIVGISPTIRHAQSAGRRAAGGRLRALPPGSARRRHAAGAQPARRRGGHERRCAAKCRRSIPTSRSSPCRRMDQMLAQQIVAVPRVRQPLRDLRGDRAGDVGGRALRGDGLFGHAADGGDRRAHGARRAGQPGLVADPASAACSSSASA